MNRFGYHLTQAGYPPISNFGTDLQEGLPYVHLLDRILPTSMDRTLLHTAQQERDIDKRLHLIIKQAETAGCRSFVSAKDVRKAHTRLNVAFVAGLFNNFIGIQLPSDEEIRSLLARVDILEAKTNQQRSLIELQQEEISELKHRLQEASNLTQSFANEAQQAQQLKDQLACDYAMELEQFEKTFKKRDLAYHETIESLKSTHRQQMRQMETQHASEIRELKKEMLVSEDMLRDFLQRHGDSGQPMNMNELGQLKLRDMVMSVLELHDVRTRQLQQLDTKLGHLQHVNSVIGDKVQEYAETMIKSKKTKTKLFPF